MQLFDGYRPEVRRALPSLVAQRWLTNVGLRIMFTFLPAVARGTGLSIEELGRVLTLRDLSGLGAPFAGKLADRRGVNTVMMIGAGLATTGVLLSVFSVVGLVVGFVLMGLGKVGFDVALNAWVGHEVSYERRGRAFGLLELTWAAAALIGIPIAGVLIDRVAWWFPLVLLGLAGVLVQIRMYQVVDRTEIHGEGTRQRIRFTPRMGVTMVGLGALTLSSQLLFVSHGIWLDDAHGLNPARIGYVVVIFGAIEAFGTLSTSALTDRLGKRRAVVGGGLLLWGAAGSLAVLDRPSLGVGLVLLALAFLGFEFSFVSSLPLIAELDPTARAQTMGLFLGFGTLTRSLGSLVGTMIYVRGGFAAVMIVCSISSLVGVILVRVFVIEPEG